MARSLFGGFVGGLVLFLVSLLFWNTPLSAIGYARAEPQTSAAVQTALAQSLTTSGTGTYVVPDPSTPDGTTLYGRGPVAVVHFNTAGYPVIDTAGLIGRLIFALVSGVFIAGALRIAAVGVPAVADRVRVALAFAFAIPLYVDLGQPLLTHAPWGFWIYSFVADVIGFAAAGVVIARWFLPRTAAQAAPSATPL